MRSWIHFTRGRFVRQARVGFGDLREEHLSRHGFAGPVAMLYRTDGPTRSFGSKATTARQIDSADVVVDAAICGGPLTYPTMTRIVIADAGRRCPIATATSTATCSTSCTGAGRLCHRVRAVALRARRLRPAPQADDLPPMPDDRKPLLVVEALQPIRLCEHE